MEAGGNDVILTLVRELRRSQGRYARSALVLVLLAAALASFSMVSIATRASEQARAVSAAGYDREHLFFAGSWSNGTPVPDRLGPWGVLDADTLATLTADIRAVDPHALVKGTLFARDAKLDESIGLESSESVLPLALVEGRGPGPGEIAIAWSLADTLGTRLGGDVTLTPASNAEGAPVTLTVVGILRELNSDFVTVGAPAGIVSPIDATALRGDTGGLDGVNAAGERTVLVDQLMLWNGAVPAGATEYGDQLADPRDSNPSMLDYVRGGEALATVLAALLTIATLVAAGVAGRNQGQARSQWVGTMRALGATRREVVAATLLEAAATGAVAAVLGGALGWGVNAALLARANATHPATFLPTIAPYPAWAVGITALIGILLAGALGGVPAYWAARTSPSEALKPTTPFDARPPSWRISTAAFGAVALAAGADLWLQTSVKSGPWGGFGPVAWVFAMVVLAVGAGAALLARLAGVALPRLGALLARSPRPWLFAAGDSLRARPKQATGVATVFAVPGVGIGVFAWASSVLGVLDEFSDTRQALTWTASFNQAGIVALATSATLGIAAAVLGVALWMGRGRDAGEAATRGALGLSRHARQLAAMAESSVSGLAGGVIGVTLGALGAALTQLTLQTWGPWAFPVPASAGEIAARLALMYAAALVGVGIAAAVVSLWSARSVDAKTPADARRIASLEGAP